jgi:hypothetical protein
MIRFPNRKAGVATSSSNPAAAATPSVAVVRPPKLLSPAATMVILDALPAEPAPWFARAPLSQAEMDAIDVRLSSSSLSCSSVRGAW